MLKYLDYDFLRIIFATKFVVLKTQKNEPKKKIPAYRK